MNIADIESRLLNGDLNVRFHNGVGFMQAYLTEDIRLHVWHPELTVPLESFGNRHDHRFHLDSHVLLGAVVDTTFFHYPALVSGKGRFHIYTVMPAHFGETPIPQRIDDSTWEAQVNTLCKMLPGNSYTLPHGIFHESRAEGLTVTIMKKSNQVEDWARILATPQQKPEHGMLRKPKQGLLDQLFFSALRKLPKEANDTIERITSGQ